LANGSGLEELDFDRARRLERDALKDREEGDDNSVGISLDWAIEGRMNAGSVDKSLATAPVAVKILNGTAVRPVVNDLHLTDDQVSALLAA
jgi:hypothetical protein